MFDAIRAFMHETVGRVTSAVPTYWKKVQALAGGVAAACLLAFRFEQHLTAELVPWLHHAFTGAISIVGAAQLTCTTPPGTPSPTAAIEARLASLDAGPAPAYAIPPAASTPAPAA